MIWFLTLLCIGLCAAVLPGGGKRLCPVCGRPARPRYKYCQVCWPFCNSIRCNIPIKERIRALIEALDGKTLEFRCYYTGKPLVLDDPKSQYYLTFDHIDPRGTRVVVCARFINDMKKDLTEDTASLSL